MKKRFLIVAAFALSVAGVGAIVACSSSDTGTTTNAPTPTNALVTRVTAASGGTVTDPAGKVSLAIPPGALEKDTDITLAVGGHVVDVAEVELQRTRGG